MATRESDRRCIGRHAEYPGAYAWPDYEYRCPDCQKWTGGSDVTLVHDDGTESVLCSTCAGEIDFTDAVPGVVTQLVK
jgi:hypothetical protein